MPISAMLRRKKKRNILVLDVLNLGYEPYLRQVYLMRKRSTPHSPIGVTPDNGYHSSISSPFVKLANSTVNSATSVSLLRFPLLYNVKENDMTSGGTSLLKCLTIVKDVSLTDNSNRMIDHIPTPI